MENGLLFNPAAEKQLDDELKRLQGVERLHRQESWLTVVIVSSGVGLAVGLAVGALVVGLAKKPAPAAAPPSP
jgi:cell division protein FtsX